MQTCGCVSKKNTPTLYVFCWNKTLYTTLHTPVQKHTPLTYRWKSLYCMGGVSLALSPLFWQFLFILGPNSPLSRTLTLAERCQDQCVRFKTKKRAETLAGVKYNILDCVFISILSPQTKNVSWLWAFYACRRSDSRVPGPWSPAVIDLEAKWLFKVVSFYPMLIDFGQWENIMTVLYILQALCMLSPVIILQQVNMI